MAGQSSEVVVRGLLGLLGLAVGIVGGWVAWDRTGSLGLALFVGLMAANYIGRGVADVITDPQKGRRFVFFTLPLVLAVGGLTGTYAISSAWWIAVIVGFVVYVVGYVIVTVMFPAIAGEEAADTMRRMGAKARPDFGNAGRPQSYAEVIKRLPTEAMRPAPVRPPAVASPALAERDVASPAPVRPPAVASPAPAERDVPRPAPVRPPAVASQPASAEQIQWLLPKGLGWTVDDVYALEARGEWAEALARWRRLLAPFSDPAVAGQIQDWPSHRQTWLHIGLCARHLGELDQALEAYGRAEELAQRAGDARFEAEVLNCIGVVHRHAGRQGQALEVLRRALPMAEAGGDLAMSATIHDNTALAYLEQGRLEDALAEESRADEILESAGSRADAAVRDRVRENLRAIRAQLGQPA